MKRALSIALCALGLGCGPAPAPTPRAAAPPAPSPAPAKAPAPAPADPLAGAIAQMLERVEQARALPAEKPVRGRLLGRDAVIARIIEKAERDVPKSVLEAQGELLRAFGLIPPDYDFVGGIYELIKQNVAGLYDDDAEEMILLDDLSKGIVEQTLAHELVHALQDQHYGLDALLKYTPGQSDRITAVHALVEGDATSAMLEITAGSAFRLEPRDVRLMLIASVALSVSGAATPRVLQGALVAPYVDGFAFVQGLRARGGWPEVERAWKRLPASTEQLLHLDKYDAREPPLAVPEPPLPGEGWKKHDADVLGEQGLRLSLEQWTVRDKAAAAAAGWGGDQYLVARRATPEGMETAVAWHVRFDSEDEAKEAAAEVKRAHPKACAERADLGPLAWEQRGDAIAFAAGPYLQHEGGKLASRARCPEARAWLEKILAAR